MSEMMGCGHSANAKQEGRPVCVICLGIVAGANVVVAGPDLTGREAECDCRRKSASSLRLPFFSHKPDKEFDGYYCGHAGWD